MDNSKDINNAVISIVPKELQTAFRKQASLLQSSQTNDVCSFIMEFGTFVSQQVTQNNVRLVPRVTYLFIRVN